MNDQLQQKVLNNLITLYQSRGLSPEKLFQNSLFHQLPIEQKIAMVKRYGEQNQIGKRTTWDKEDTKKLLLGLGLGALAIAVAVPAYRSLVKPNILEGIPLAPLKDRIIYQAPTILGAAGAATGAAVELENFYKGVRTKQQLNNLNTNDDNAIINYLARVK